jgi:nitrite reductase/ring-hydroxylating ferredoxin subunit
MSDNPSGRRQFLKSGGCAAAALAACMLLSADLRGLPVFAAAGEDVSTERGEERRYPMPPTDSVTVDHDAQVLLVRYEGHVFGMSLVCPHEHAAVRWVEKDHRFQCTKHDSRYQEDGVHISGRATRNLDRFPIRREAADVVLTLDRVIQSDTDPAGWAAAVVPV